MLKSTSDHFRKLGFTSPGILINEDQARTNIRTMAEKARRAGAVFRPHFKTHQSADVGRWFADEGVDKITVSSVAMAEYFAANGWDDITIAFLLNPLEWPRLEVLAQQLAGRGGSLGVTVDCPAAAAGIAARPDLPLAVWIKVDAGYGRTGIPWHSKEQLQRLVNLLAGGDSSPHGRLRGLLTHGGNSYHVQSPDQLAGIWKSNVQRLSSLAQSVVAGNNLLVSMGDTPSCGYLDDLSGVQEIRPGNFVFFDLMQHQLGVCQKRDLAVAAVCPVVGLYPDRRQIVIHSGAVHLSRQYLIRDDGIPIFGYLGTVSAGSASTWEQKILNEAAVTSLSQEHGTIDASPLFYQKYFARLEVGDLVLIWPVHSCLTCDLAGEYRTTAGAILNKKLTRYRD